MANSNPNTEGIRECAAERKRMTAQRADAAINAMLERGEKVNFSTVSKESGISRSALYDNLLVRERISSLRMLASAPPKRKPADYDTKMQRMAERVRRLEEEKSLLVAQVVELDLLRRENEELKQRLSVRALRGR